ncbi:MAG: hypothetical protein GDA42_09240 [Ekhidna sp.]|nr:hypothetical protein [Ekhidna sp.]MBC6410624.1 hypothetical protein [Ekhidna sp.]
MRQTSKEFDLHLDNYAPRGTWSDGTTLWVADSDDYKLYAYNLSDGMRQTTKEFDLHADNANPEGTWSDGTTLWVADWEDDKLYAYPLPK